MPNKRLEPHAARRSSLTKAECNAAALVRRHTLSSFQTTQKIPDRRDYGFRVRAGACHRARHFGPDPVAGHYGSWAVRSDANVELLHPQFNVSAASPTRRGGIIDLGKAIQGVKTMATVYVEPRPKGRQEGTHIDDYVVEDHADHVLKTFKTQHEAIDWAKK